MASAGKNNNTSALLLYICVCVRGGSIYTQLVERRVRLLSQLTNNPVFEVHSLSLSLLDDQSPVWSWQTSLFHCSPGKLDHSTPLHPLHKRPEVSGRKVKKKLNTLLGRTTLSNSHTPIYININMQLKGSSAPLLWPHKGSQKINNVDTHNAPLHGKGAGTIGHKGYYSWPNKLDCWVFTHPSKTVNNHRQDNPDPSSCRCP